MSDVAALETPAATRDSRVVVANDIGAVKPTTEGADRSSEQTSPIVAVPVISTP
jgi:hypothetical protein